MTTKQHPVFDYIFNLTQPGVKLELDRIKGFMAEIGEPWQAFRSIHIAGTNGKGSTAAITAALLQAGGYRTGLFTSPHLVSPNERIRINGRMVDDMTIIRKVSHWKPLIDQYELTFFELLTALGLDVFRDEQVDFAVLETGLGGRLDATNVVNADLAVITAIDMDHTRILGDTLAKIAGEKAGIIKPERPVLAGENPPEVIDVLRHRATALAAPFQEVGERVSILSHAIQDLAQQVKVAVAGRERALVLKLLGDHQLQNLANALAALDVLGIELTDAQLATGMEQVYWPARLEILNRSPLVMYDVAHNPSGLKMLLQTLSDTGLENMVLLAGLNEKKDLTGLLRLLESWAGPCGFFAFEGHFAMPFEVLQSLGLPADRIFPNLASGLEWAERTATADQGICVFGSHYFAPELYVHFEHPLSQLSPADQSPG